MTDWPRSRFARSLLPAGIVLLALWVLVSGYGIVPGELEESRPITVVGLALSLVSIVSIIGAGWLARRRKP
ncbi:MAG: hypothetical protein H0X59_02065 [Chloroflexi bacterium]|nr:hypothetical protein [Chloroflexota bacterium]